MKQNIVILGATSGIGKELARLYAKNGAKVAITGRRTELLKEMSNKEHAFIYSHFDITDIENITATLNDIASQLERIDTLIISSGTGDINEELDFTVEKRTIDTNITGFTCVCNWVMNYFGKQGSGHLVAITSIAGIRGSKDSPAYNASKSYQINYLEGMRQKAYFMKKPIYVTDIRPGFVDTDMAKGEGLFWVAPVDKAAKQILQAIHKRKQVVYITKRWRFIGEILKCIPRFVYNKM